MPANGVDFVDEDDARRVFLSLFEQVAYAAGPHAHKHLHKIRAGDGEEGHIGLTRHRTCQQSLAGSGRSYEQHAFGNSAAQLLKLLRLAQEFNDFPQLLFGFIDAGYVLEGDLFLLHREQARAALTEGKSLISASLHLADHEVPERGEKSQGREIHQPAPAPTAHIFHRDIDVLFLQLLDHIGVVRRYDQMEAGALIFLPVHFSADQGHFLNRALIYILHELGEVNLLHLLARLRLLDHLPQQDRSHQNDYPKNDCFYG